MHDGDHGAAASAPSADSAFTLLRRFAWFGIRAWGGPVAQIDLLRRELVERDRWVDANRFNRVLAVYQALPGPEALELCVYFGMVRRGRLGGMAAGVGFMLPGVLLVLACAWAYTQSGLDDPRVAGAFTGLAAAAAALVLLAVYRIGRRAAATAPLLLIAAASAAGFALQAPFWLLLAAGALAGAVAAAGRRAVFGALLVALTVGSAAVYVAGDDRTDTAELQSGPTPAQVVTPELHEVAASGARAGLLTFGGAYTAITFVEHDAVREGRWLTHAEFLDSLAVTNALPAPLISFTTFVGYVAGGLAAAFVMTLTVFAPAFAIPLVGHRSLERIIDDVRLHALLDGVTAAVVGLMAVTAWSLCSAAAANAVTVALLAISLLALVAWPTRGTVPAVLAVAAGVGAGLL